MRTIEIKHRFTNAVLYSTCAAEQTNAPSDQPAT